MVTELAAAAPHTTALIELLESAGILAGRGEHPEGGGWQGEPGRSDYIPYVVVYPFPGSPDGNTAEPYEYLDYKAQVSCWGATAVHVEEFADRVRGALIGKRLTVPGRSSYPIGTPPGAGRPVARVDQVQPPEYHAVVEITARTQAL